MIKLPTLIYEFPRFMGDPIQNFVALNKDDFLDYVKSHLQHTNIYISVYTFSNILDKDTAKIDKIFFDLDSKDLMYDEHTPLSLHEARLLHEELKKDGYIHLINSSSEKGYHIFLFTEVTNLNNKTDTIFNIQTHYEKILGLKTLDPQIKGDIRRIFRVPNTKNFNKNRICVNLNNEEILYSNVEIINDYAQHPREIVYFGSKLFNPKSFDKKREYNLNINTTDFSSEYSFKESTDNYQNLLKTIYDDSPKCIRNLINKRNLNYSERYFIMVYLKETYINNKRITYIDIINLMKLILTEEKFIHFSKPIDSNGKIGEGLRPLNLIMQKNYYIPTCEKIKNEMKLCDGDCGRKHPKYGGN